MKVLIVNGPNINFLGIRQTELYGNKTYEDLKEMISKKANFLGLNVEIFQSNHEGSIIDKLQEAYINGVDGIIINPGAYTHTSIAIFDALSVFENVPKIEVHITNILKREDFRKKSVTGSACTGAIMGLGLNGYLLALEQIYIELKERGNKDDD